MNSLDKQLLPFLGGRSSLRNHQAVKLDEHLPHLNEFLQNNTARRIHHLRKVFLALVSTK